MGKQKITRALQGILLAAFLVFALACAQACLAYNAGDPEFRAIYADAWVGGYRTAAEINQLISDAHYANANTIVVQVRRRGDTIYPSSEPTCSGFSSSFDSLADLIQKCHTTSPRLDVQAWFVVWPVASVSAPPSSPSAPFNKYRQYLTKDATGVTNISGDYWFDPGNPGAEQYTYNIIMDVVNRYDVDAINFDYIRFGDISAGYNDVSVARFNAASARYAGDFSLWRRDQLTNFVRKVYANAIAAKPNIKITADCYGGHPAPTTLADFTGTQAWGKFQNFPAWLQEGILDVGMAMTYFDCAGDYGGDYDPWVCFMSSIAYNRQTAVLPGIYSTSCLYSQLLDSRNLACGHPVGAGVYDYRSMDSSILDTMKSVWTTPAPVPPMPWKTSPTKGHIKGNVTFASSVWIDGAYIHATGPGFDKSMYTDGTGFFAFIDVPPGDYTVSCNANGYGTTAKAVHVTAGHVASADCDFPLSTLIISNIQVPTEGQTTATITWTTNAGASSKVYYGLDRTCSSSTTEDTNQVTSHSVNLSGLTAGKTYYFRVYSKNPGASAAISTTCALVTDSYAPSDIIIDNPQATLTGNWTLGTTAADRYGADYALAYGNDGAKTATYTPNITMAGTYRVYEWHTGGNGRDTSVPITVYYNGGSHVYTITEYSGGGAWNLLGSHPFAVGTSGKVTINNQASGGTLIVADAIKFSWPNVDTGTPSVPTGLTATNVQDDTVSLDWNASTDDVGVMGYRVLRGTTASNVTVVDSSPTDSYTDTDVAPNTHYYYAVSSYDTAGNKSANTSTINFWTLCPKPTSTSVTCDKQSGVWHTSGPFTFTAVGGFGPGFINYYRYAWDTSPSHDWTDTESAWVMGTNTLTATTSAQPYYLHIKGYNQLAVPGEPSDLGPYYVDATAPGAPTVTDEKYTASTDTLKASWSASDPESGITQYEYAVGTTALGNDIKDWTSAGTDLSETITGLSLNVGTTYYVSVRATNGAGLVSDPAASAGVKVAQTVTSIQAAKALANDTAVALPARVISTAFPDAFYVEEDNRVSGIRVELAGSFAADQIVTVLGKLGIASNGERAILDAVVPDGTTTTGTPIQALAISTKGAAGKALPAGKGLDNTGLLVKIAGKVTSVVSDGFYLDDASKLSDSDGTGIKVWTGSPDSATTGASVTVTGVISLRQPGTVIYPQILKRDMAP